MKMSAAGTPATQKQSRFHSHPAQTVILPSFLHGIEVPLEKSYISCMCGCSCSFISKADFHQAWVPDGRCLHSLKLRQVTVWQHSNKSNINKLALFVNAGDV